MAEINVEKKGGATWLWVLLALAVVALLAWLLFSGDDAELAEADEVDTEIVAMPSETEAEVVVVEDDRADIETTAENLTDDALGTDEYDMVATDAPEAQTRIAAIKADGYMPEGIVALNEVRVTDVVGDRTFLITDDSEEELLVVLDEVGTPNDPTEGRYDITEGQIIDVTGTVREVQDGMIDGQRIEDMPQGTNVYLWADKANIEERP
jgi:hypothetical protein